MTPTPILTLALVAADPAWQKGDIPFAGQEPALPAHSVCQGSQSCTWSRLHSPPKLQALSHQFFSQMQWRVMKGKPKPLPLATGVLSFQAVLLAPSGAARDHVPTKRGMAGGRWIGARSDPRKGFLLLPRARASDDGDPGALAHCGPNLQGRCCVLAFRGSPWGTLYCVIPPQRVTLFHKDGPHSLTASEPELPGSSISVSLCALLRLQQW